MGVTHTRKIDGEKLRQAREQHGWKVEEAAEHFGVSKQAYYRWEKSEVKPHSRHLDLLYKTFQLTPEELHPPVEKRETSENVDRETAPVADVTSGSSDSSVQTHPKWKLPTFFTTFIGREQEIGSLCAMLVEDDVGLVTIWGPGGVGKTRLSLQVAVEMRDYFVDGICFVSLASVDTTDDSGKKENNVEVGSHSRQESVDENGYPQGRHYFPDLISALAQSLGIQEDQEYGAHSLVEQIEQFLHAKRVLLILDSFEKVDKAASYIEDLLDSCPGLKVLATSRNLLRLGAEHDYYLERLALPNFKDPIDLDVLTQCASVRLFSDRAKFAVTSENAQMIAKICVRLDGLPLAIELAAAGIRIKLFSLNALLKRLSDSSQILKSSFDKTPQRQRNLYNTVKWSYDLLDEQEQRLFRSLSIFSGGFTLEGIEAFYKMLDPALDIDVTDKVKSLLSKSLIQPSSQEDRFTMLETIHEYGLVFLQEHGEMEACQRAHAMYYLDFVERVKSQLEGKKLKEWLEIAKQEKENINVAWTCLDRLKDVELLLRFGEAWGKVLGLNGEWTKAREILKKVLDLPKPSKLAADRAKILRRAGYLAYRRRDLEEAQKLLKESEDISRKLGDEYTLAGALSTLGWVLYRQKKVDSASLLLRECVDVAWRSGSKWAIANAQESFGRLMFLLGNTLEAYKLISASVAISREPEDKESLIRILLTLVSIEIAFGKIERAVEWSRECTDLAQSLDTEPLKALALDGVEEIALFQGEYEKAVYHYSVHIELAEKLEDETTVALKKLQLGELMLMQGFSEQAITLIQESQKFSQDHEDIPNIAAVKGVLGEIERKKGKFKQAREFYTEALQINKELKEKRSIGKHLFGLAKVALDQKRVEKAARLLVQVKQYLNPCVDMHLAQRVDYEQAVERVRVQLGEEAFAGIQSETDQMTIEQVLDL